MRMHFVFPCHWRSATTREWHFGERQWHYKSTIVHWANDRIFIPRLVFNALKSSMSLGEPLSYCSDYIAYFPAGGYVPSFARKSLFKRSYRYKRVSCLRICSLKKHQKGQHIVVAPKKGQRWTQKRPPNRSNRAKKGGLRLLNEVFWTQEIPTFSVKKNCGIKGSPPLRSAISGLK